MEHELDYEHRLTEVEQRSKSNTRRLDTLEKSTEAIHDLATSMKVMVAKQDAMNAAVNTLTGKVEELEAEPGKKWKAVTEKVILGVVAAVVGFVLAHMGF